MAIERGDDVIVEFGAAPTLTDTDCIYVSGTPDALEKCYAVFPGNREQGCPLPSDRPPRVGHK